MAAFGALQGDTGLEEVMAELNDTQVHPAEAESLGLSLEEPEGGIGEGGGTEDEEEVHEVSHVPPHGSADDECRILLGRVGGQAAAAPVQMLRIHPLRARRVPDPFARAHTREFLRAVRAQVPLLPDVRSARSWPPLVLRVPSRPRDARHAEDSDKSHIFTGKNVNVWSATPASFWYFGAWY